MALVAVNYGSSDLLVQHLAEITAHTPGLDIVVVDNFSTARERRAVEQLADRMGWRTRLRDDNAGFGTGVNEGVAATSRDAEVIVLLNPDAVLDATSMQLLVEHVRAHPTHLAAPLVHRPDGRPWSFGSDVLLSSGEMRGWHRRPAGAEPTTYQPWLSGACLALTHTLWDRIGGFDDDYFLYWEDVDLCRRVLAAGGELRLLDQAVAVHDEGGTHRGDTDARAKSATYYYWNARNRLVFAGKHLDAAGQRRWLLRSPGAGYRLLLQGGKRQFKDPRRTLWPVVRGTWDGWRAMRSAARARP